MMPEINTLTEIVLAIDADAGQWMEMPRADVATIPVWGFANEPEAEMRLLRMSMDDCFRAVRELLDSYHLTFEQELAIYNQVPVGENADVLPRDQLVKIILEACDGVR